MATIEELVLQIAAENKELKATLADSSKAVKSATEQMALATKQFADKGSKDVGFFQNAMSTMTGFVGGQAVIGAFMAAKDAVVGLAKVMIADGIESANAQEKAITTLSATLAATGRFSQQAVAGFEDFANKMEATANVSDDLVISQAAVLAGMTKLSNDGIQKAISSATDLSAVMGISLEQAVQMVGKAANGQTDTFRRMGIVIDETGSKGQVFERTLATINSRFGGAAAKQAETFSGSITKLQNSFGNFAESIGAQITSNQVVIKVISELSRVFGDLEQMVVKNKAQIQDFISNAVVFAVDATQIFISVLDGLVKAGSVAFKSIVLIGQAITDLFQALWEGAQGNFKAAAKAFDETGDRWGDLKKTLTADDSFLGDLSVKVGEIGFAARQAAEDTNDSVGNKMVNSFKNAKQAVVELDETTKAFRESQASFAVELANQFANFQSGYQNASEFLKTQLEADAITVEEYYMRLQELQAQNFQNQQQALVDSLTNESITQEQFRAANYQLAQQQALEEQKLEIEKNKKLEEAGKKKIEGLKGVFGQIAQLQSSSNAELAAIGKAAALAQATIDGIAAVQGALKVGSSLGGPGLGFAFAAAVGAAQAANVAKIAGVGLAGGIDSVPRSSNGGNSGDNFPAILQPGERVVPTQTNRDLTEFLENGGGGREITINIRIENNLPASREAGQQMIDMINDAISAGALPLLGSR